MEDYTYVIVDGSDCCRIVYKHEEREKKNYNRKNDLKFFDGFDPTFSENRVISEGANKMYICQYEYIIGGFRMTNYRESHLHIPEQQILCPFVIG